MINRNHIKSDLKQAMKARDMASVMTLRSLLAAIDNAESVQLSEPISPSIGKTNDVPRRELTEENLQEIFQKERDERLSAITEYERFGKDEEAERLRVETALIASYLDDIMS